MIRKDRVDRPIRRGLISLITNRLSRRIMLRLMKHKIRLTKILMSSLMLRSKWKTLTKIIMKMITCEKKENAQISTRCLIGLKSTGLCTNRWTVILKMILTKKNVRWIIYRANFRNWKIVVRSSYTRVLRKTSWIIQSKTLCRRSRLTVQKWVCKGLQI